MARGNHVDLVTISKRFGLYIVTPASPYQSFSCYQKIYLSKKHRIIGLWGIDENKYRDYMDCLPTNAKLIRRTDRFLFFEPIKEDDGKTYNSFAEGLYQMSQKGIFGARINLTKKRAWILRDMIKRLEDYVPEEDYDDYCATLEWMRQEIKRRYSEFDLGMI